MGDKAKSAGIFNECTVSFVPGTLLTPSAISEVSSFHHEEGFIVLVELLTSSLSLLPL